MKTQHTAGALDDLVASAPASNAVVCAQNGVENERLALRRFAAVYAMCVMLPAVHLQPGAVDAFSVPTVGILDVGRYPDGTDERAAAERALRYMDLTPGTPLTDIAVDTVFVGSCTNGRIEDLRAAAEIIRGHKVSDSLRMLVVPGSMAVKVQAEQEGLDDVFRAAGFDWREPGCSMCLAMNPDKLAPGERCASTSNRNFEGRQGKGGRTHLVSPAVAAATAVAGHFATPEEL